MSWGEMVVGTALGAAGGIFSAHQANKFAERMSNTAHQREVADLKKAGLNPMLSANRGASSPGAVSSDVSGNAGRGAQTALQVAQQKATIELTKAQADAATAAAGYTRVQRDDLTTQGESGRYQQIRNAANVGMLENRLRELDIRQREELYQTAIDHAKKELELRTTSAEGLKVQLALQKMLAEGSAKNISDFEKNIGQAGPAVKFLIQLIRLVGDARVENSASWMWGSPK